MAALPNIYKEYNPDVLIADGRNLYTALKVRIPFLDFNREHEFGYAGYTGMLELALTILSPVWDSVRKPASRSGTKFLGIPVTAKQGD